MEVIYLGIHRTPEEIVQAALEEDVDVIALSILSGAHKTLLARVKELLKKQKANDILLVAGGVIGAEDREFLESHGVAKVFGPGTSTQVVCNYIEGIQR
jgi:methylmalonyl-CoA mutase C-terminal domain/subunit